MQRVNLYRPELREKKEWLTARSIAGSSVGFFLIMVFAVIMAKNGLSDFEANVVSIENQKKAAEARVEKLKNMPKAANAFQIDRRLKQLKMSVQARQQIGQIIEGQNLGNESGFSGAMEGFARNAMPSLSLAHIRVSRGGSFVELQGQTRAAEDVPLYLAALKKEDSFLSAQFGVLSVAKKQQSSLHRFSLGFDSVFQLANKKAVR